MNGFEWPAAETAANVWGPTVLVVEDERELADLYSTWLSDDYTVRTAYDGEEALTVLDESVDVVLLDRRMPGLSGGDVLTEIRDRSFDCRVALVTAVTPDFDMLPLDFDEYLTKPVAEAELKSVVSKLVQRSALHDELQQYFALLAKKSKLEAEKRPEELVDNVKYNALREGLGQLRAELDSELAELSETEIERATQSTTGTDQPAPITGRRTVLDGAVISLVAVLLVGIHVAFPNAAASLPSNTTSQASPLQLLSASFVHLGASHLLRNVIAYLGASFFCYYLCLRLHSTRWFYLTAPTLILAIALLAPLSSYYLYGTLFPDRAIYVLGFSSVVAGFGGFSFLALLFLFRTVYDHRTVFFIGGFVISAVATSVLWAVEARLFVAGVFGVTASLVGAYLSQERAAMPGDGDPRSSFPNLSLVLVAGMVYSVFGLSLFPSFDLTNTAQIDVFGHLLGLVLGFVIAFGTAFLVNLFPLDGHGT